MNEIIKDLSNEVEAAVEAGDMIRMAKAADELLLDKPDSFMAAFALGNYFLDSGRTGLAAALFRYADGILPGRPATAHQLAICLGDQHPLHSLRFARRAYERNPTPEYAIPLLQALSVLGKDEEAIRTYEKIVDAKGMDPRLGISAAFSYLRQGDWERGWRAFSSGEGYATRVILHSHLPLWQPRLTMDGLIVIHGDQGIGDELLFSVFLSEAIDKMIEMGNEVHLEVLSKNVALFKALFGDRVISVMARGEPNEASKHYTHRISFPRIPLSMKKFTPHRFSPFIQPTRRRGKLRVALASLGGSKVTGDIRRSIPAEELIVELVERFPEVEWECADYKQSRLSTFLPWKEEIFASDSKTIAAYLHENIDIVVCPTTSIADICGVVGVKCFAMVDAYQPGWRYLPGDEWWTAVKSAHQVDAGDWAPVFEKVRSWIGLSLPSASL